MPRLGFKTMANEFYKATKETFKRQESASPCIYFYNGKFQFSPGDTMFGHAEPVYNNKAQIVVDTLDLKEYVYNKYRYKYEGVAYLENRLKNFYDEVKESKTSE